MQKLHNSRANFAPPGDSTLPPASHPAADLTTVTRPGLKLRYKKRLGLLRELELVTYQSHGTRHSLQIKGRLLETTEPAAKWQKYSDRLANMLTTVRQMESDEIPGALLEVRYQGVRQTFFTDHEGYFVANIWAPEQPFACGWHEVQVSVLDSIGGQGMSATAHCMVPDEQAEFGIISDLDDTVIESSAFNRWTHIKMTLLKNAAARTPVREAAPLYQRLVKGGSGSANNPMFYLSRSGWNLNPLFEEFLRMHELPPGPMFLRDLAFREAKSTSLGTGLHKVETVRYLLQAYPQLPFVLLGDSGQHDPETYWQIALENPGRIKAIYLHDVARPKRDREVAAIARDLEHRGVPVMHAENLADYAAHMVSCGLIADEC